MLYHFYITYHHHRPRNGTIALASRSAYFLFFNLLQLLCVFFFFGSSKALFSVFQHLLVSVMEKVMRKWISSFRRKFRRISPLFMCVQERNVHMIYSDEPSLCWAEQIKSLGAMTVCSFLASPQCSPTLITLLVQHVFFVIKLQNSELEDDEGGQKCVGALRIFGGSQKKALGVANQPVINYLLTQNTAHEKLGGIYGESQMQENSTYWFILYTRYDNGIFNETGRW